MKPFDDEAWYKKKRVPGKSRLWVDTDGKERAVIDPTSENMAHIPIAQTGVAVFCTFVRKSNPNRIGRTASVTIPLGEGTLLVSDTLPVKSDVRRFAHMKANSTIHTTTIFTYLCPITCARAWG